MHIEYEKSSLGKFKLYRVQGIRDGRNGNMLSEIR